METQYKLYELEYPNGGVFYGYHRVGNPPTDYGKDAKRLQLWGEYDYDTTRQLITNYILRNENAVNTKLYWYWCGEYTEGPNHWCWHRSNGTEYCQNSLDALSEYNRNKHNGVPYVPWYAGRPFAKQHQAVEPVDKLARLNNILGLS